MPWTDRQTDRSMAEPLRQVLAHEAGRVPSYRSQREGGGSMDSKLSPSPGQQGKGRGFGVIRSDPMDV